MTESWEIREGDCLERLREMQAGSVHCCVTSPPYWGLRDYGVEGQLGLEKTPREYIEKMVAVFAEVRRVLRGDGTLWLNIGDSYANDGKFGGETGGKQAYLDDASRKRCGREKRVTGLKAKDLVGIPWQLAFALRDAGWWLRSEIIWSKPNGMTESVEDRPTKSHEQVFLLTQSARYFYDNVASAEKMSESSVARLSQENLPNQHGSDRVPGKTNGPMKAVGDVESSTANMRSVWRIPVGSFKGAHFATMPLELVRKCLVAGTSEFGVCKECGSPWRRTVEKVRRPTRPGIDTKVNRKTDDALHPVQSHNGTAVGNRDPQRHCTETVTTGFERGCKCDCAGTVHALVLDPFSGAGTVGVVARRLGLRYLGIELNPEYAAMSRQRIRDDRPLFNAQVQGMTT